MTSPDFSFGPYTGKIDARESRLVRLLALSLSKIGDRVTRESVRMRLGWQANNLQQAIRKLSADGTLHKYSSDCENCLFFYDATFFGRSPAGLKCSLSYPPDFTDDLQPVSATGISLSEIFQLDESSRILAWACALMCRNYPQLSEHRIIHNSLAMIQDNLLRTFLTEVRATAQGRDEYVAARLKVLQRKLEEVTELNAARVQLSVFIAHEIRKAARANSLSDPRPGPLTMTVQIDFLEQLEAWRRGKEVNLHDCASQVLLPTLLQPQTSVLPAVHALLEVACADTRPANIDLMLGIASWVIDRIDSDSDPELQIACLTLWFRMHYSHAKLPDDFPVVPGLADMIGRVEKLMANPELAAMPEVELLKLFSKKPARFKCGPGRWQRTVAWNGRQAAVWEVEMSCQEHGICSASNPKPCFVIRKARAAMPFNR